MIGSTSFDGFSNGVLWNDLAPDLQKFFVDDLGASLNTGLELAFTVGLLFMIAFVFGVYRMAWPACGSRPDKPWLVLARRFVISLVPISLAYVVAHYFSLLAYQGQAMASLASDPLGTGSDLFGTGGVAINYGVVSASGIWYVQVGALVIGHVAGLMVAHDRARGDLPRRPHRRGRSCGCSA